MKNESVEKDEKYELHVLQDGRGGKKEKKKDYITVMSKLDDEKLLALWDRRGGKKNTI